MESNYTQDVEFNSGFGAMQTPVHVFTAAVLCGHNPPDISAKFRFLDLGCGNGLTLALLADAYPHGKFVGIDINPSHIQRANARRDAAGLKNLEFHVGDVLSLSTDAYGSFDLCAVSGIYSWLDAKRRKSTRTFLNQAVRPGGLVYLDYSTQPGMAQSAPLYRLLRELSEHFDGSSADKLSAAARHADQMRKNGAAFFKANPLASTRLEAILKNPPEDEAHEVLNLQEGGFWSADVLRDMAAADFDFVGHSSLHHNFSTLSTRPDSWADIEEFAIPLQQTLFDANWSVPHRRDIFIKRDKRTGENNFRKCLGKQNLFSVKEMLSHAQRKKIAQHFPTYDFCTNEASQFAEAALVSSSFAELFDKLDQLGFSENEADDLTRHFLAMRLISISIAPAGQVTDGDNYEMGSELNYLVLTEDIGAQTARPFSSPVVGTRVLLPVKDRLYLWALIGLNLQDAWDKLGDMQSVFRDKNNHQINASQFSAIIQSNLPGFRQHVVPEMIRMQIVKVAPK